MDTPLAANIINLVVGTSTFLAVVVALGGIWLNRKQAGEDWLHSQQQAKEERKHQIRPIMAPKQEIPNKTMMVSDQHVLYDKSRPSQKNPWFSRMARLTLTYHDLFGTKYVSAFHYTQEHRWIHIVTEEITGNPARDLKELNMQKKQQGPKHSAP